MGQLKTLYCTAYEYETERPLRLVNFSISATLLMQHQQQQQYQHQMYYYGMMPHPGMIPSHPQEYSGMSGSMGASSHTPGVFRGPGIPHAIWTPQHQPFFQPQQQHQSKPESSSAPTYPSGNYFFSFSVHYSEKVTILFNLVEKLSNNFKIHY